MNAISILFINEEQLHRFAAAFAQCLTKGDCVALEGDLGAGKTSFARALVQSLQPTPDDVPSPTFTLLQTYPVQLKHGIAELWHYDLYRLKNEEELEELGLNDALEHAVTVIEWPAIAARYLPSDTLYIRIDKQQDEFARLWHFSYPSRWQHYFDILHTQGWISQ